MDNAIRHFMNEGTWIPHVSFSFKKLIHVNLFYLGHLFLKNKTTEKFALPFAVWLWKVKVPVSTLFLVSFICFVYYAPRGTTGGANLNCKARQDFHIYTWQVVCM